MPGGRYGLECKIYVGDLPRDASEQELQKAFSYYGALKNVWVARNPPGFAFIEYDDVRDAEDAVRGMDGTTLCGSRIRCEHSSGKSGPKPWSGSSGGGRGRDGGGRGPPRLRKPYDPNDRCYECGGRGHYAYDCTRGSGGRKHSRSRSGSRDGSSRGNGRRDKSPSTSRGRYYRGRSRSRSRGRYRTRSRSGSRSPERSAARYRSRSRSPARPSEGNNKYSRSRSRERKSDHGSPSRNGGD